MAFIAAQCLLLRSPFATIPIESIFRVVYGANMKSTTFSIYLAVAALLLWVPASPSIAQLNTQMLEALVLESERTNALPKPVLEDMLNQGVRLEEAAAIAVSTATTASYAEAYTHYSICMAVSERQAEDIYNIVTEAARDDIKPNVLVEARYTLDNYIANRCESLTVNARQAPESNLSTENTVGARASISQ